MKLVKMLGGVALGALLTSSVQAAVIVNYNTTGLPGSGTAPASLAASGTPEGITGNALVRGPGIVPAVLANGFSSDNWTVNTSANTLEETRALAITNGDYYEWSFVVQDGYEADLATLDLNHRRSATNAHDNFDVYASLTGFATAPTETDLVARYMYLGRSSGTAPATVTPYQWMTTDTPGQGNGNPIETQSLSNDAFLQNIVGAPGTGTTVTFRLYAYGNRDGSAATNTIALGRSTATDTISNGGPLINGTVTLIPEPATFGLLGVAGLAMLRRRTR